jgi:hypothetical protein
MFAICATILLNALVLSQAPPEITFKKGMRLTLGVLHLTDENFEKALDKFPFMLIFFHHPDCDYCKKVWKNYQAGGAAHALEQ